MPAAAISPTTLAMLPTIPRSTISLLAAVSGLTPLYACLGLAVNKANHAACSASWSIRPRCSGLHRAFLSVSEVIVNRIGTRARNPSHLTVLPVSRTWQKDADSGKLREPPGRVAISDFCRSGVQIRPYGKRRQSALKRSEEPRV